RAVRLGGGSDRVRDAGAGTGRRLAPGRSRASRTKRNRGGTMKRMPMACGLAALAAASGIQAATQVEQCAAARNKIAAQYHSCREKAEAKAIRTLSAPDYARCADEFSSKWSLTD